MMVLSLKLRIKARQAVGGFTDDREQVAAKALPGEAGVALQRVERNPRRLVTVFGELRMRDPVYSVRRKQKIQRAPLDGLSSLNQIGATMLLRWIQAVLLLPGTVLIVVPATILHFSADSAIREVLAEPGSARFALAIVLAVPGAILGGWTTSLFIRFGDGTAAPWDPPQKLVVRGPYRHVRNPMISGVLFLLIAESLMFDVTGLLIWTAVFYLGNSVYFPLVEEPGLRNRFGEDYDIYYLNVGRWIPRLTPWSPSDDSPPE